MKSTIRLVAALALVSLALPVFAQRPMDVVKWSVKDGARQVKAGATVSVELTAEVAAGWHLYALTQPKGGPSPLRIAVAKGMPFEVRTADIVAPAPEVTKDANFDLETRQYDGKVLFAVPVAVSSAASPGPHAVPIEITFQACGNGICLRPFTQTLPVELIVGRGPDPMALKPHAINRLRR